MRVLVLTFVVFAVSLACADDGKPEKAISELQFFKQIIKFKREAVKLSGTSIERETRLKKVVADFQTEFADRFVEFQAVISDVKWNDGWAKIKVISKTPGNFGKAAGLALIGELPFRCEQDSTIVSLNGGQNVIVRAHLFLSPGIWTADPDRGDGASMYRHYSEPLQSTFDSRSFELIVGKEVFSFEQPLQEKSEPKRGSFFGGK